MALALPLFPPQAFLPVSMLQQGPQELELDLQGSKPGKLYGKLKVAVQYNWLRGTEDDGTYTKVNRLVLHRTARISRSGAPMAAVEALSQVNHALLSHDNMWAVLDEEGGLEAGRAEGFPAARHVRNTSADAESGVGADASEQLPDSAADLVAAAPVVPVASSAAQLQSRLDAEGDGPVSGISQHAATALLDSLSLKVPRRPCCLFYSCFCVGG
jgi:hypothetical protein